MDNELAHLRADGDPVGIHLPVPDVMSFETNSANNQLKLRLSAPYASRFRMVLGYVGEIQLPPRS